MQVSAISSSAQNFQGKRTNIDQVIHWDDNDLREMAFDAALKKDQKRRRNVKRLYYAVPLVGGLAAAAITRGKSTILSREISGLSAKVAGGLKEAGYWTFILGTAVLGGMGINALSKKSENFREFRRNHPVLSLVGDVGLFVAATSLIPVGAKRLYSKIKPEYLGKIGNGVDSVANHINSIKKPEFMKNWSNYLAIHTPDWLKALGNTVLAFAPHITLASAFLSSIRNDAKTTRDFYNNYAGLKDFQHRLATARVDELKQAQED